MYVSGYSINSSQMNHIWIEKHIIVVLRWLGTFVAGPVFKASSQQVEIQNNPNLETNAQDKIIM